MVHLAQFSRFFFSHCQKIKEEHKTPIKTENVSPQKGRKKKEETTQEVWKW